MKLIVNGDAREVEARDLAAVLSELDLNDAVVATAVNGDFVPAVARARHALADGDRVEIVSPRQGG